MLPLLLALLGQPPDIAPDEMPPPVAYEGLVAQPYRPGNPWVELADGGSTRFVSFEKNTRIVWHLDPRVELSRHELRPGVRVRYQSTNQYTVETIEAICLGPLAMEAVQEEWVIAAAKGDPSVGLSPSELATMDALGSPSWLVRDAVARALAAKGPRALRPLLWMRHARDPEVRARAEALLWGLGWDG